VKRDTILKVNHKEGTSQKGRPYSFYVASVLDEDGNVFAFNISDDLVKLSKSDEGEVQLKDIRNDERTVDVEIRPKGFDCAGTIVAW